MTVLFCILSNLRVLKHAILLFIIMLLRRNRSSQPLKSEDYPRRSACHIFIYGYVYTQYALNIKDIHALVCFGSRKMSQSARCHNYTNWLTLTEIFTPVDLPYKWGENDLSIICTPPRCRIA